MGTADETHYVKSMDLYQKLRATPIKERVQVFYRYKALLEKHLPELTALVGEENGKTTDEARAEVDKAIELTDK